MIVESEVLTTAGTDMVKLADRVSTAKTQKVPVTTKVLPPGTDSVSALLARFFNTRGQQYQLHTDRGAEIGREIGQGVTAAAKAYEDADTIL
ncbi:PE family protein [Mycobacterium haemophilum]|uniref:PE family protein n=1 Tax=Mycobacterium haemophilum TaxID=29311 RepID=UPI0006D5C592|nr:PE family protein [Mycobacterium haemophilum]MCV7341671.1 PE family protein [Mycobacterium haemophilum DSM 44634]